MDLKPYSKNAKKHPESQLKAIAKSIKEFGWQQPIVVDKDNEIIVGHGRWFAYEKFNDEMDLPKPEIKVARNLTKEQAKAYRLADNKLNESDWDMNLALPELKELSDEMFDLIGFDRDLMVDVQEDNFDAQAEYDKIIEPKAKLGDLYQLGEHRLLCGDSTKKEDVGKLMGGVLADMVFTDPPYNVNYNYAVKYQKIHKARKKIFLDNGKIFNDKKKPEEFYQFLLNVFRNIYYFSADQMSFYCCYAIKSQNEFFKAYQDAGFHQSQIIIWLKERIILALGQDYHRIYEPIIFGWKNGKIHYKNKKLCTEKEVWDLDKIDFEERLDLWFLRRDKSKDYEHPTQKPIRLPERAIKKNSKIGDIVFEPFSGSGSTMLACEQLKRRCYAIELDPKYVDVGIKRYETATGQKAKKIN